MTETGKAVILIFDLMWFGGLGIAMLWATSALIGMWLEDRDRKKDRANRRKRLAEIDAMFAAEKARDENG